MQRSFRQKALQAHPDKGGSEEDFQELQAMVEKLQMPSEETSKGFFGMNELIKQCREAREASDGLTAAWRALKVAESLHFLEDVLEELERIRKNV